MTTFALVATVILVVLCAALVVCLAALPVLVASILRDARQIHRQLRPLAPHFTELARISGELVGHVKEQAQIIRVEASDVAGEVSHRAERTAWLYRQALSSPIASLRVVIGGVRLWRAARRLRRLRLARPAPGSVPAPATVPMTEEELRKAA